MFRYKNYLGRPEVDTETQLIQGRLLNIADLVEFSGRTVEQAEADFQRAVDRYLQHCNEQGKEPEKPFSGKLPFRTSPEIHRDIYIAANRSDLSINAWMEAVLSQAAVSQLNVSQLNVSQLGLTPSIVSLPSPSAAPETLDASEPSLAEYRGLLTKLQAKINLLQETLMPYLKQQPGIFADLLNQIKPILKDKDLPVLIDQVEQISRRLDSIRDQAAPLLPLIEPAPASFDALTDGLTGGSLPEAIPEVLDNSSVIS